MAQACPLAITHMGTLQKRNQLYHFKVCWKKPLKTWPQERFTKLVSGGMDGTAHDRLEFLHKELKSKGINRNNYHLPDNVRETSSL